MKNSKLKLCIFLFGTIFFNSCTKSVNDIDNYKLSEKEFKEIIDKTGIKLIPTDQILKADINDVCNYVLYGVQNDTLKVFQIEKVDNYYNIEQSVSLNYLEDNTSTPIFVHSENLDDKKHDINGGGKTFYNQIYIVFRNVNDNNGTIYFINFIINSYYKYSALSLFGKDYSDKWVGLISVYDGVFDSENKISGNFSGKLYNEHKGIVKKCSYIKK